MDQQYSQFNRLRQREQFQRVFKARQRLFAKGAGLYYLANGLPYSRLGVITSKRNQKTAVARNFIRRRAREMFRRQAQAFNGVDIIVVTTSKIKEQTPSEQKQCLKKLFSQLNAHLSA